MNHKLQLFFCLLMLCLPLAANRTTRFKQLTVNEGLAHTDATCITQDNTGLIWIGTYAGLQSYDGYTLQRFDYYQEGQKIFQSHNRIRAIVCAGDCLWVGTESGLACFDLNAQRYVPYTTADKPEDLNRTVTGLCFNTVSSILLVKTDRSVTLFKAKGKELLPLSWNNDEDRLKCNYLWHFQAYNDCIWGGTQQGLIGLKEQNGEIALCHSLSFSSLTKEKESIRDFYFQKDTLYIRSESNCYRMTMKGSEPERSSIASLNLAETAPSMLHASYDNRFVVTTDGNWWCLDNTGLIEIRAPFSGHPSADEYLRKSSSGNPSIQRLTDLLIDKYNNLWVTASSWGVVYHSLSKSSFNTLSEERFSKEGLSRNEVVSVAESKDGTVWMIVEYGNLFRYDMQADRLAPINLKHTDLRNALYQCLCLDKDGEHLYIGTNRGLFVYTISSQEVKRLSTKNPSDHDLLYTSISFLTEDEEGRLWAATWGEGMYCIDHPSESPSINIRLNTKTDPPILSDLVSRIHKEGNSVFLCTVEGLNRIRIGTSGQVRNVSSYRVNPSSAHSISNNYLVAIDCENDSVCWVGTIGGGLNRLTLHSDKDNDYTASVYGTHNGLPDNDCEIVMLDESNNVWVAGNSIACLNPESGSMRVYGGEVGNKAFKVGVSCKSASGKLYMGGLYGLTWFDPDTVLEGKAPIYDLVFTDLTVNNVRILPQNAYNGNKVLEQSLDNTRHIRLNHHQGNFILSFAALGYGFSEAVIYRYRMKGISDEWMVLPRGQNRVYFSNLAYGSYKLEVQYSSDQGYTWQTPGRYLEIDMLPPWWLSGWAKLLGLMLIAVTAVLAFRHYDREQKLKKENEIQKILLAQDEEKYQAKIRFFMNASHELKTPLTLIMLWAEKLVSDNRLSRECNAILSQTKRMLALIAELVDFRKTDLGLNSLNINQINMTKTSRKLFDEISPWANKKQVAFVYSGPEEEIIMDADAEKINKMIVNLLSNAVKYTGEGGRIDVSIQKGRLEDIRPFYASSHTEGEMDSKKEACILSIRDTGVGISSESIRQIYERFFQVNGASDSHLGSGIGLAIVKNIVIQHQGVIIVSSERYKGTEFIVALPIYNKCTEAQDGEKDFDFGTFIRENYNELTGIEEKEPETLPEAENANRPTLLIVEDNQELREILKEHFAPAYNVRTASNGREGLDICLTTFPDAIVSDVMMPEMDGIEMCRRIKNNLSVAYIPLVLLTAKDNVESQIDGYESGADLYLSKPFSMKLLEVNLQRLLKQREKWMKGDTGCEAAEAQDTDTPETHASMKERDRLVARLKSIIDEHITETGLSPDYLAAELGISRSKIYQKVGRIDGMSLADYVRNRRLEKAARLLVESDLTIQEIIGEVGLTNASHFSKIFRMKYGMSPYEYKQK